MDKKRYVRPETVTVVVETESFICLSWDIEKGDNEGGSGNDGYIVPPGPAGETDWTEKKEEGGGIWGDLD